MPLIVAATGNLHKLSEYREMLADQKVEIASLRDRCEREKTEVRNS